MKYRKDDSSGYPEEAVNYRKIKTICKVSDVYRAKHGIGDFSPFRYDVIAICNKNINWYKNAFEYC